MTAPTPLMPPPQLMALPCSWAHWITPAAAAAQALPAQAAARAAVLSGPRAAAPLHGDPLPVWVYQMTGERPYPVEAGLALLSVSGLILPSLGVIGAAAATGCAELAWQVEAALADPYVNGLAVIVDSPGGYIAGVNALSAQLRRARAVKPVAAVVTGNAYSAAYWIAAGADSIAVERTGGVGSVGVMVEHLDDTRMMERLGLARTVIAEGARKAEFDGPLSEAAAARLRAEMAELRDVFVDAVIAGRGAAVTRAALLATESACLTAMEGLEIGLVDAIADPREALAAFAAAAEAQRAPVV